MNPNGFDLTAFIREQVNEVRKEEAAHAQQQPSAPVIPQQTQQQPADGPLTLTINGSPVTFKNQADLEAQLNATAAQWQQLQAKAAAAENPEPPKSEVAAGKFDQDKYIKLMTENPVEAQNYVLNHTLFDGRVDDAAGIIRDTLLQSAQATKQLAAYQFRDMHREVPLDNPQVQNIIDSTRKSLGLPFTPEGIEAAYAQAVISGRLPNYQAIAAQNQQNAQQTGQPQQYNPYGQPPPQQQQFVNPYAQNPYGMPQQQANPYQTPNPAAPPATGRGTNTQLPVSVGEVEDMSVDQLQSLLMRFQNAGITQ